MSSQLEKFLSEDKVWETLSSAIVGKVEKTTTRGFVYINCPVCPRVGNHRHDTKFRCGVIYDAEGIGIHCFNCGIKMRFQRGSLLTKNMEMFLFELGVSPSKIKELYFWAWEVQKLLKETEYNSEEFSPTVFHSGFKPISLPDKAKPIVEWAEEGCSDKNFLDVLEYLMSRGDDLIAATQYYWTPQTYSRRLIVPFYYEGNIIGWTGRSVDDVKDKYFNQTPNGYLFNCDVMRKKRKYLILTEGIFDALAIDCVALQTNDLDEKKISWINSSKQTKIVVPDRDKSGRKLVDIAESQGWHVAFPRGTSGPTQWWDDDIKDIADATKRYGRLWTLRSIVSTASNMPAYINSAKNYLKSNGRRYSFEE